MANLRIIHDNAADRATIAASSTAGALSAALMQNDYKGQAHRSVGTSVSYTLTWATPQTIGGIALPASNLSAAATIRVRLYSDAAGATLLADSGAIYACPGLNLGMWDWTLPLNANAFAFGGTSKSAIWFAEHYAARRCVIDLADPGNAAGYIDCSRIVAGGYWSPQYNADYGAQVGIADTTEVARNDAGDLLPDLGTRHDTMSFNLSMMPEADRARLMMIFRGVGTGRNFFISLLPNDASSIAEQDHMLYGKRANSSITMDFYNAFSNGVQLEGW